LLYEQAKTSNKPYGTGRTQEKSNSLDHNTVNKTKGSSVAEISSEGKQTKRCSKDGRDNKNLDFSVSIWHFEALEITQLVIDIIS
jgi:hypothetical protein